MQMTMAVSEEEPELRLGRDKGKGKAGESRKIGPTTSDEMKRGRRKRKAKQRALQDQAFHYAKEIAPPSSLLPPPGAARSRMPSHSLLFRSHGVLCDGNWRAFWVTSSSSVFFEKHESNYK